MENFVEQWAIGRIVGGYDSESYPCDFIVVPPCPYADLRFSSKISCNAWLSAAQDTGLVKDGYKPFLAKDVLNRHESETHISLHSTGLTCPICQNHVKATKSQTNALETTYLPVYLHCAVCNSGYKGKRDAWGGLNCSMVLRKSIPLIPHFEDYKKDWMHK